MLAKHAVRACARLGGYLPDDETTPDNPAVKKSLCALLTPYVSKRLSQGTPAEVEGYLQTCSSFEKAESFLRETAIAVLLCYCCC